MEKMTFSDFANAVVKKIREYLPETFANAAVEISTVMKNNDTRLTGLTIRSIDQNISPTIYLEQFFEKYQEGEDMNDVLERIADLRISHELTEKFDTDLITDFDRVKGRVIPKLINRLWNEELLKERVHTDIAGDLTVTYQILLKQDFSGSATIGITNKILKMWGIDVNTLHELAVDNMKELTPSTFEPMSSVLASMMDEETAELFAREAPVEEMMWILSNKSRINGASAILDSDIMQIVKETLGTGKYYLLCSSVHEWIAVKGTENMDVNELGLMIKEVNEGQVSPDERLSDHPYVYSMEKGLLSA